MNSRKNKRFEKLVSWDVGFYNSLSDDDCIVCLTEKQVYLVGQIIDQLTWWRTRWIGNSGLLDVNDISANLEHRLSDKMTCEQLTQLINKVNSIDSDIQIIKQDISGDNISIDNSTELGDTLTAQQRSDFLGGGTPSGDCDLDELYAAVGALVDYIHDRNSDMLLELSEFAGDPVGGVARLISGIPVLGALLPADEAMEHFTFLVDELGDNYESIADVDFLREVKCDLFCYLRNDSPCGITIDDFIDFYNSKTPVNIEMVGTTIVDIISLLMTGNFAGDQFFWVATGIQMLMAFAGEEFFGKVGFKSYEHTIRAAYDDPDNDWTIFCTDCPDPDWCHTFDFTTGTLGWSNEPSRADWVTGEGWRRNTGFNDTTRFVIYSPTISTTVVRVAMTFSEPYTLIAGDSTRSWRVETRNATELILEVFEDGDTIDDFDEQLTATELISDEFRIAGVSDNGFSSPEFPTTFYLRSVTLWGTGSNPFGSDNC